MKKIILTIFLLLTIPILTFADDIIYDKPYGGKRVGKIDDKGFIYDCPYGCISLISVLKGKQWFGKERDFNY